MWDVAVFDHYDPYLADQPIEQRDGFLTREDAEDWAEQEGYLNTSRYEVEYVSR